MGTVEIEGNGCQRTCTTWYIYAQSTVANTTAERKNFDYILQVVDDKGFTRSVNWFNGTIGGSQKLMFSNQWIPEQMGNYTVQVFIWSGIEGTPISYSPPFSITLSVVA